MSARPPDDDIEFDFFEDDTSEQSPPDWLHEEEQPPVEQPRLLAVPGAGAVQAG